MEQGTKILPRRWSQMPSAMQLAVKRDLFATESHGTDLDANLVWFEFPHPIILEGGLVTESYRQRGPSGGTIDEAQVEVVAGIIIDPVEDHNGAQAHSMTYLALTEGGRCLHCNTGFMDQDGEEQVPLTWDLPSPVARNPALPVGAFIVTEDELEGIIHAARTCALLEATGSDTIADDRYLERLVGALARTDGTQLDHDRIMEIIS